MSAMPGPQRRLIDRARAAQPLANGEHERQTTYIVAQLARGYEDEKPVREDEDVRILTERLERILREDGRANA